MKRTSNDGIPARERAEQVTLDPEERARLEMFFREHAERKSVPPAPTKSELDKSLDERMKELLNGKQWLIEKVVAWQVHRAIVEGAESISAARLRKFRKQAKDGCTSCCWFRLTEWPRICYPLVTTPEE